MLIERKLLFTFDVTTGYPMHGDGEPYCWRCGHSIHAKKCGAIRPLYKDLCSCRKARAIPKPTRRWWTPRFPAVEAWSTGVTHLTAIFIADASVAGDDDGDDDEA